MPQGRDLVQRLHGAAEAAEQLASAIENRRVVIAEEGDHEYQAAEQRKEARFLRDLADAVDRHGDGHPLLDEIARDVL